MGTWEQEIGANYGCRSLQVVYSYQLWIVMISLKRTSFSCYPGVGSLLGPVSQLQRGAWRTRQITAWLRWLRTGVNPEERDWSRERMSLRKRMMIATLLELTPQDFECWRWWCVWWWWWWWIMIIVMVMTIITITLHAGMSLQTPYYFCHCGLWAFWNMLNQVFNAHDVALILFVGMYTTHTRVP